MRRGGEATGSIGVSVWLAGGGTAANGCDSVAARSGMARLIAVLAEHAAGQVGRGAGAALAHDGGAIAFDRPRTEAEIAGNFLVGLADRKPRQHLALAGAQRLAAGNVERDFRKIVRRCRAALLGAGFLEPLDDFADRDRLCDENQPAPVVRISHPPNF